MEGTGGPGSASNRLINTILEADALLAFERLKTSGQYRDDDVVGTVERLPSVHSRSSDCWPPFNAASLPVACRANTFRWGRSGPRTAALRAPAPTRGNRGTASDRQIISG